MKGAITDPCVKTTIPPIRTKVIIRGANQYFFLAIRNSKTSVTNSKKELIVLIIFFISYYLNTTILKNYRNLYT